MTKTILLITGITVAFCDIISAQTALVNPHPFFAQNRTAFYFDGSLETVEDKALGGNIGIVVNRVLDVGVGVGKLVSNDELAQLLELNAFHISPHITFFPVNQNNAFPLTVGMTGGYSYIPFSSPLLDEEGASMNSSDLTFQFNIFSNVDLARTSSFIVGGSVIYISRTLKISENSSVILKETVNEVGFNFHFGIRAATSLNNYFYLGPKLTVIDNTTSFSIVAGFGFGKNETDKTRDSGKDFRTTTELDDLIGNVEFSQLPNFRAAVPKSKSYSDEEILELFRKKYPNLGSRSDEELILLIEKKYGPK